jgi:hypothetical protein
VITIRASDGAVLQTTLIALEPDLVAVLASRPRSVSISAMIDGRLQAIEVDMAESWDDPALLRRIVESLVDATHRAFGDIDETPALGA